MKITYYGHSCFLLELEQYKILFDPFISSNHLASHIDVNSIYADIIFQSHGHDDHIADLIPIAKRCSSTVVCSWEISQWLLKNEIEKVHPMNIGGEWDFDFGKAKMVYAAHSNSLPDGSYGGTAAGFILEVNGKRIYYAGDTGLTNEMKLIGEYWKPDLAIFPIGGNFTMNINDAIIASDFVKCNKIIGMHYDTFGFIEIDHNAAIAQFNKAGKELQLLTIGQKIFV